MRTKNIKSQFTLIELLIVVSILAILAAILLPSLMQAKELSRKVLCNNNQRQIFLATSLYIAKNDNYFPQSSGSKKAGYTSWDDRLSGYDGRTALSDSEKSQSFLDPNYKEDIGIYQCPSSPPFLPKFASYGNGFMRTYALNQFHHKGTTKLGVSRANGATSKLANISDPSNTIVYMEKKWCAMGYIDDLHSASLMHFKLYNPSGPLDYGGQEFHKSETNYSFADGSAKSMNFWDTLDTNKGDTGTIDNVQGTYWDATK